MSSLVVSSRICCIPVVKIRAFEHRTSSIDISSSRGTVAGRVFLLRASAMTLVLPLMYSRVTLYRLMRSNKRCIRGDAVWIDLFQMLTRGLWSVCNNNNNCLKSNIQCIEIRVQWTVHLGSSHMHVHAVTRVHAVTPKLVICVMYLTSI